MLWEGGVAEGLCAVKSQIHQDWQRWARSRPKQVLGGMPLLGVKADSADSYSDRSLHRSEASERDRQPGIQRGNTSSGSTQRLWAGVGAGGGDPGWHSKQTVSRSDLITPRTWDP